MGFAVTSTTKFTDTFALGVPDTTPDDDRLSPVGNGDLLHLLRSCTDPRHPMYLGFRKPFHVGGLQLGRADRQ